MAVEDYIARGPAPSQIQSMPEIAAIAAQGQAQQQTLQINALKLKEDQLDAADQMAARKAYTTAYTDPQLTTPDARYTQFHNLLGQSGVSPKLMQSIEKGQIEHQKDLAAKTKLDLENDHAKASAIAASASGLLQLPDDQLMAQLPVVEKQLIDRGVMDQSHSLGNFNNPADARQALLLAKAHGVEAQDQSTIQIRTREADSAAEKADTEAKRFAAELPGIEAESARKKMVFDAMKAAQADPRRGAAAIDAALPPNVDAQANAGYQAAYTSAMQAGNMDAAAKIVEAAAQHSAGMSPAVLKKEVDKAVAIDKATQPLKLQQVIATARAMSGTGAVANVPPHLAPAAIAAYQKSGSALATAQTAADDIKIVLDSAAAGNKAAGANVPLVGVGALNAVNGIKRINSAEIQQYGTAGSLIDRIQGKLQGWAEGQPIPKDVLNDMSALHQQLAQGAVMKHAREVQSINQSYGSNFTPMQLDAKPQAATFGVPDTVKSLLGAASVKPGVHKLSDGSTWVKAADGSISKQ